MVDVKDFVGKLPNPLDKTKWGTAWLFDPEHALIAAHCVGNRKTEALYAGPWLITFLDQKTVEVSVEACDFKLDTALLKLATPVPNKVLPLGALPVPGQYSGKPQWYSYGFPEANPAGMPMDGEVKSPNEQYDGQIAIQLECKQGGYGQLEGASGMPICVDGKVIGVCRAGILQQSVIYATSMRNIANRFSKVRTRLLAASIDTVVTKTERDIDINELPTDSVPHAWLSFLVNRFALILSDDSVGSSSIYQKLHSHINNLNPTDATISKSEALDSIHKKTIDRNSEFIISDKLGLHEDRNREVAALRHLMQHVPADNPELQFLATILEPGMHVSLSLFPELELAITKAHPNHIIHSLRHIRRDRPAVEILTYQGNSFKREEFSSINSDKIMEHIGQRINDEYFILRPYGGLILDQKNGEFIPAIDQKHHILNISADAHLTINKNQRLFWEDLDNIIRAKINSLPLLISSHREDDWTWRAIFSWIYANKKPDGYTMKNNDKTTSANLEFSSLRRTMQSDPVSVDEESWKRIKIWVRNFRKN